MNKRTTLALLTIVISFIVTASFAGKLWETDFEKASANAKASNRYMLLDFSGSDWCGWCVRLEEEVFSEKEFEKYAKENLICVLLDFPRGRPLKKKLAKQNEELKNKYNIRGFPSVLILSPSGEKIFKTGYKKGGPEKYVEQLDTIISMHRTKNNIPAPTAIKKNNSSSINSIKLTSPTIRKPTRPKKLVASNSRELRMWKARNGASIKASIIEEKGTLVILKKEDGSIVKIPKRNLSTEDQTHIKELIETESSGK